VLWEPLRLAWALLAWALYPPQGTALARRRALCRWVWARAWLLPVRHPGSARELPPGRSQQGQALGQPTELVPPALGQEPLPASLERAQAQEPLPQALEPLPQALVPVQPQALW
jgi:hypothetical protein